MNKKRIYISLFSFYIFLFTSVNAQSINIRKDSVLYISLNGGSSIPIGYFKSPTYLGYGGYAMNGYGGKIEIEHPLKLGWFGLAFGTGYYVNSFNLSSYKNVVNPYWQPYSFIYYRATPYKEIPILAGIFFEKQIKRFTFEFKSMAGINIIIPPYVNTLQTNITYDPIIVVPGAAYFMEHTKPDIIFTYYLSGSIRYSLMKHISVQGNVGYLNNFLGKPDLSFPSKYWHINIPLSQLHLEIGVVYHF